MRGALLTVIVFTLLIFIIRQPYIGVLTWAWLGYMNPHRLAWTTAIPYSLLVAIVTLLALMVSKEPKRIPWTRESILLLVLIAWMFMTTVFSLYPWLAWEQWDKVWRIMLMTYVTMMLINNEQRIKLLVFVIALSLGFYGFKGGWFTIATGGVHSVMGPAGSFIGDRNSIGLALIMTVPLLYFIKLQMTQWYFRWALLAGIGLTLVAIVGTQSRGAAVGIALMLFFYLLKSRQKFSAVLALVPLVLVLYYVMPEQYFERVETIQTWEEDGSASERVRAWQNAIHLANHRFIGGGMRALVFYGGETGGGRDSHSIYFGILGEHGWVGLGMFLLLIGFTWQSGSWIIRRAKRHKDLYWARDLASMVQVSLVGYMAAGAFLGLQYFDLFYHLVAIIVVTKVLVAQKIAEKGDIGDAESLSTGRGFVQGEPLSGTPGGTGLSRSPLLDAEKPGPGEAQVRSFVRGE